VVFYGLPELFFLSAHSTKLGCIMQKCLGNEKDKGRFEATSEIWRVVLRLDKILHIACWFGKSFLHAAYYTSLRLTTAARPMMLAY
jgi:hypothetical protein